MNSLKFFQHWTFFYPVDWENIYNPYGFQTARILFIAKTNSGKSWINRQIQSDISFAISSCYTFCPTEFEQQFYQKFTNKGKIFEDVKLQKIAQIKQIKQQQMYELRMHKEYLQKQGFQNQFFKFVPMQYMELVKHLDRKIDYKTRDDFQDSSTYKQYVLLMNMDLYYELLFECIGKIQQLYENRSKSICKFLKIEEKQMTHLSQTKIEFIVKHHFQKMIPSVLLIFDDTMSDPEFMKESEMKALMAQGRHTQMTTIMTTQYLNAIQAKIRANFGYIIVSAQDSATTIKQIREQYLPNVDKKTFDQILDFYTKDYGCIVIDNVNIYQNTMEKVMCYRATDMGGQHFFVGSLSDQMKGKMTKELDPLLLTGDLQKIKEKYEQKQKEMDGLEGNKDNYKDKDNINLMLNVQNIQDIQQKNTMKQKNNMRFDALKLKKPFHSFQQ